MKNVVILDAKKIKEIANMNPEVDVNALNKLAKLNKVEVEVEKETKIDGRTNNTGRPVNKKSARQARLAKQAFYNDVNNKFVSGVKFKLDDLDSRVYSYDTDGVIMNEHLGYVCNVNYIGRTKVQGFTYVLGKQVKIELNLKTLKFVK